MGDIGDFIKLKTAQRLPEVLSKQEVQRVLSQLSGFALCDSGVALWLGVKADGMCSFAGEGYRF